MQAADLEKSYDPKTLESKVYEYWMTNGHFRAKPEPGKEAFTIVIPPPNITGSLHMGHALDNTIQDVLTRFHRMSGKVACWVPGTDHAGIATQTVVEKELKKEGKTRHDLGREEFIKRVWVWREKYGNTITEQLKRLGVSCDWDRQAFTMDAPRSKAVRHAFVHLYNKGDIYRGKRLINWCTQCLTALSDLEVEHETSQGNLYYLRYPIAGEEGTVVIATTRPETIMADVAIAVNPTDERFSHLVGKKVQIPTMGREIPVIADEAVLTDFGTGALKITPAHDPVDYEVGQRHNLPQLSCMDETGKINELGGKYQGLDRFVARKQLVKDLDEAGLLVEVKPHENNVGHCYRCHSVLEPYLSDQWFMSMKRLAQPAIDAAHSGEVSYVPDRYNKVYLNWMENIRDWCISRQIWWGHRIPVWTCGDCGHVEAHKEDPSACPKCASANYQQDPDVLDTWFSSGLWPIAVFGWPEKTEDLDFFYPTSVLVTARDIIYLWVARMIMTGYEFMGKRPFKDVLIHATIQTKDGQRMSKSKGTGVDPLDLIEKYGADGTRFALMLQATHSQDIRHNEDRYEMGRNFCTKIWNAVKLSLRLFPEGFEPIQDPQPSSRADRWILGQVNHLAERCRKAYATYDLDEVAKGIYEFFWNEFCDWYLEMIKPVFYQRQDAHEQMQVAQVLCAVLDRFLRIAHPVMPFLSEELWHQLPGSRPPLILSPFPTESLSGDAVGAVAEMDFLQNVVRGVRNLRAELNLAPKQKSEVKLLAAGEAEASLLRESMAMIGTMAASEPISIIRNLEERPAKALSQRVGALAGGSGVEIFLPFPADYNAENEIKRLQAELVEAKSYQERIAKKLENPGFVDKAKPEVVAKERERHQEQVERVAKVEERLRLFQGGN